MNEIKISEDRKIVIIDPWIKSEYMNLFIKTRDAEIELMKCFQLKFEYREVKDELIKINFITKKESKRELEDKIQQLKDNYLFPQINELYNNHKDTFTFQTTPDIINDIGDVMQLDKYVLDRESVLEGHYRNNTTIKLVMLLRDNNYLGHVMLFLRNNFPDFCGIYGLKASVLNILANDNNRKRVARSILKGVQMFAKENKRSTIIVPWPLETMTIILRQTGFKEHIVSEYTPERLFFAPFTSARHYYVGNVDSLNV